MYYSQCPKRRGGLRLQWLLIAAGKCIIWSCIVLGVELFCIISTSAGIPAGHSMDGVPLMRAASRQRNKRWFIRDN
jgi:hypothetical protein